MTHSERSCPLPSPSPRPLPLQHSTSPSTDAPGPTHPARPGHPHPPLPLRAHPPSPPFHSPPSPRPQIPHVRIRKSPIHPIADVTTPYSNTHAQAHAHAEADAHIGIHTRVRTAGNIHPCRAPPSLDVPTGQAFYGRRRRATCARTRGRADAETAQGVGVAYASCGAADVDGRAAIT